MVTALLPVKRIDAAANRLEARAKLESAWIAGTEVPKKNMANNKLLQSPAGSCCCQKKHVAFAGFVAAQEPASRGANERAQA